MPNGFAETSSQETPGHGRSMASSVEMIPGRGSRFESASAETAADDPDPDEEDQEEEGGVGVLKRHKVKKIQRQPVTRALVCFGALSVFALGLLAAVMGIIGMSAASWMSTCLGGHANQVAVSGVVLGLVAVLLSLLGCLGAVSRKKPCFCLFGLMVVLLLAVVAGGVSVIGDAQTALDDWERHGWRVHDPSSESLHTLYVELAAVYAFCAPNATAVGLAIAALDGHLAPPPDPLSCRQGSSAGFAEWVNGQCLQSARFSEAQLFVEIAACRGDVLRAQANGTFDALVASDVGDTAWLFCTCGRPLKTTLEDEWFGPARIVLASLTAYSAVLVCLLCAACSGASKAKKRKKKQKLEEIMLTQARQEAGEVDADES